MFKISLEKSDEYTDYNEIFKFLNLFIKEIKFDLFKFDRICEYLRIPNDIRSYAKNLLIKQEKRFTNLKSREKFLVYFAAFFVSYIIVKSDYSQIKENIDNLIKIFDNNPIYITRYVDLNKMLSVIRDNRYHQYLITPSLTQEQKYQYITNIYRIEIMNFFKIIKGVIDLSFISLNIEDLIESILFVIKNCNENYENVRKSRYSSACYFILSNIDKLKRYDIDSDPFYRSINLSRHTFYEHLDRIKNNINYKELVEKFPSLGFNTQNLYTNSKTFQENPISKFKRYRNWNYYDS